MWTQKAKSDQAPGPLTLLAAAWSFPLGFTLWLSGQLDAMETASNSPGLRPGAARFGLVSWTKLRNKPRCQTMPSEAFAAQSVHAHTLIRFEDRDFLDDRFGCRIDMESEIIAGIRHKIPPSSQEEKLLLCDWVHQEMTQILAWEKQGLENREANDWTKSGWCTSFFLWLHPLPPVCNYFPSLWDT